MCGLGRMYRQSRTTNRNNRKRQILLNKIRTDHRKTLRSVLIFVELFNINLESKVIVISVEETRIIAWVGAIDCV